MTRHLITGGAGFIGSNLAHRLVREGHDVTVLDRFSRGKSERLPAGSHGQIRATSATSQLVLCAIGGLRRGLASRVRARHADVLRGPEGRHRRRAARHHERAPRVRASGRAASRTCSWSPRARCTRTRPPGCSRPTRRSRCRSRTSRTRGTRTAAARSRRSSRCWRTRRRLAQPCGDRPAAQHLRAGHGRGARDPRVGPDDRPSRARGNRFPIQGTARRPAASATSTTASTAPDDPASTGEDRASTTSATPRGTHDRRARPPGRGLVRSEIDVIPGELPKGSPTRRLPDIGKLAGARLRAEDAAHRGSGDARSSGIASTSLRWRHERPDCHRMRAL
jgi:hypothetical protein